MNLIQIMIKVCKNYTKLQIFIVFNIKKYYYINNNIFYCNNNKIKIK